MNNIIQLLTTRNPENTADTITKERVNKIIMMIIMMMIIIIIIIIIIKITSIPETRNYWVDVQWGIVSSHGERDPL